MIILLNELIEIFENIVCGRTFSELCRYASVGGHSRNVDNAHVSIQVYVIIGAYMLRSDRL